MSKKNKAKNIQNNNQYKNNNLSNAQNNNQNNKTLKEQLTEKFDVEFAVLYMSQEEILKREESLNIKTTNLEAGLKTLADEKNKSATEKKEAIEKINELKKLTIEHSKKEISLNATILDLSERENNAENGFLLQSEKALAAFKEREKILLENIKLLEEDRLEHEKKFSNDIIELRNEKEKLFTEELEAFKKLRTNEVNEYLKKMQEDKEEEWAKKDELLKLQEENIHEIQIDLSYKEKILHENTSKQQKAQTTLDSDLTIFEDSKSDNEDYINKSINEAISKNQFKLDSLEEQNVAYATEINELKKTVLDYKQKLENPTDDAYALLKIQYEELKRNFDSVRNDLEQAPPLFEFNKYKEIANNVNILEKSNTELLRENSELQHYRAKFANIEENLRISQEKVDYLKLNILVKENSLIKLEEDIKKQTALYHNTKDLTKRLSSIKNPYFSKCDSFLNITDELVWLDNIHQLMLDSNFFIPKRLLYSFHTSIKTGDWSLLTILAGVSGTGKSTLPELYAKFGGLYFISAAVNGDWDSPDSLFGHFDFLENYYNSTDLIRAVAQFSKSENYDEITDVDLTDSILIILLDEMNLANVELYLSDILSNYERKRNLSKNEKAVTLDINIGSDVENLALELGDNIFFSGTMNEDETTKTLSGKVIDRGNIFYLSKPKELLSRKTKAVCEPADKLPKRTFQQWKDDSVIMLPEFENHISKYRTAMNQINDAMFVQRELGQRAWQSMEHFMASHPKVIEAFSLNNEKHIKLALQYSFEEAFTLKVAPKLRGVEIDGETITNCIKKLEDILFNKEKLAPNLLNDFNKAVNSHTETFTWSTSEYFHEEFPEFN